MDLSMDNNEDPLERSLDDDANEEAIIPAVIDGYREAMAMMLDPYDEDYDEEEVWEGELPPSLRVLGTRFRKIGVKAIFDGLKESHDAEQVAIIVLYLLYADLRQDIVRELRAWILFSGRCDMSHILRMFQSLEDIPLGVREIEQDHAEALLEFVDVLGPLLVQAQRQLQESSFRSTPLPFQNMDLALHCPLGAVVAAKLLQYAQQSAESIDVLFLACEHQYRAFRADEVEQFVNSILNLKQIGTLEIQMDMRGVLLVELCARLKDRANLSVLYIQAENRNEPQELPNERHLIRNIQRISSLDTLHLYFAILGESTVDLFSSEAGYTKLDLVKCIHLISDNEGKDPSELPLAVALASNTNLEYLSLYCVQGSAAFFAGIEHGLLRNRTLRKLSVTNFHSPEHQGIPESAYFGWIRSIRLHPSLRRLELDMDTWSGRVAHAVCSVVRDNTSLQSMELFRMDDVERIYNEFDPEWIGAVLQALQANRAMVDVRLRVGSDFGDRNWNRLGELLNVNDSIETIYLHAGDDESIPDRLVELLQRFKSNRTLKRLGLKNAEFRRKHTSALVDFLADNYVVSSFVYSSSSLEGDVLSREEMPISCSDTRSERLLKAILDLNYYGRQYMRTEPNSVLHGVSLLSHVSSNLDAVYFHIRENPRLCDR